ncbi:MAG: hypothetical protein IIW85_01165, partial [Bacteroidaceae bacterium]|nr:hypothetical protein [Bacteroidaceae bacterium]
DLLKILMEMGHGDEIVISDGNFPATTFAQRLVRLDGNNVPAEGALPCFLQKVAGLATKVVSTATKVVRPATFHLKACKFLPKPMQNCNKPRSSCKPVRKMLQRLCPNAENPPKVLPTSRIRE